MALVGGKIQIRTIYHLRFFAEIKLAMVLNSPLLTVTFLRILSTAGCVFAKYNFLYLEKKLEI